MTRTRRPSPQTVAVLTALAADPSRWRYGSELGQEVGLKAGSLYLGQLLKDTGGDERTAVAAYYQGLESVRSQGMLPETQRYVANVMALRSRFGG